MYTKNVGQFTYIRHFFLKISKIRKNDKINLHCTCISTEEIDDNMKI